MSRVEGGAFTRHVREALALNRARLPRYAALTGGRSVGVSRQLIRAEQCTLPAAWYVDRRARRYQAAGIPLAIDEFVSMDGVPPFRERFDPPSLRDLRPVSARVIGRALRSAWRSGGFPALRDAAEREIEALATEPRFLCTLRHLLESIRRAAHLAPRHLAAARERGLPSPAGVSNLLLHLHLVALGAAVRLDRRAAPLQAEGVPILYQDLPPIPLEP